MFRYFFDQDKKILSLLDFKRQVCISYLKGADYKETTGRKKVQGPFKIATDVRFDRKKHFLQKCNKQQRCQNKDSKDKPRTYCNKCNVTLCMASFIPFHSK